MVITDALEMRAISASVGVEEGAVLALAAGADALCLGHDLFEEATDRLVSGDRRRGTRRSAARGTAGGGSEPRD